MLYAYNYKDGNLKFNHHKKNSPRIDSTLSYLSSIAIDLFQVGSSQKTKGKKEGYS
jgi:hypothetical protein